MYPLVYPAFSAVPGAVLTQLRADRTQWYGPLLGLPRFTIKLSINIPSLVATISAGLTLMPGDIIATGTPVGVGIGFNPPKFLKASDVVTISISGLGHV